MTAQPPELLEENEPVEMMPPLAHFHSIPVLFQHPFASLAADESQFVSMGEGDPFANEARMSVESADFIHQHNYGFREFRQRNASSFDFGG